jgi:hypothetical protein
MSAGFASLYSPYGWIPAPRFHEDKLRGNDRTGAAGCCRGFGVSPNSLSSTPPQEWGIKGG